MQILALKDLGFFLYFMRWRRRTSQKLIRGATNGIWINKDKFYEVKIYITVY